MGRMPLMAGLLLLATLVVPQAWAGGATWSELSYPIGIEKHLVRSAPQVEIHSINEAGHINYGTLYRSGHTHGECGQCAAYRVLTNIRHGARGKLDKLTWCPLALTPSKYRENWSLSLTAMLLDVCTVTQCRQHRRCTQRGQDWRSCLRILSNLGGGHAGLRIHPWLTFLIAVRCRMHVTK